MSYPRNAASPPRIAIGPVVQISDGAVQTSGVSVKVKPEGAAASAGGGTISYEEGIVAYVPTQAETDYTAFQVIAYKTGCFPVAVTVVTSASATAGIPADSNGTATLLSRVTADVMLASSYSAPPSASTIASQVRTELATELARIDTEIGSRLASGGYASPLDAAGIRAAIGLAIANLDTQLSALAAYIDTEIASILAAVDTEVAAIKSKTDNLPAQPAAVGDIPTAATIADAVWDEDTVTAHQTENSAGWSLIHIHGVIDTIYTNLGDVPTNGELATAITTGLTTALTEGYRADGATGSVRDLLYELIAHMDEASISGPTKTLKKIDGTTTAMQFTIGFDGDGNPISITRVA